jgi:WD40 repeat protein
MKNRETIEVRTPGEFDAAVGSRASDPGRELPLINERRFEIAGEHARGGSGLVLEATDRLLGRRVALKQPQQQDRAHEARFLREALITARLQHPAIVPIYDLGVRSSGEPCYSMRLVPGATLRDAIVAAPGLDERLALLPHVQAVADAIAYAHQQGIVHRDLKPANVLVGPFGETVVIDWGLAKDLRGDPMEPEGALGLDSVTDGELTRTGAILGTPAYMAPEQARGEAVDESADVYAIGAMLYHLLTGEAPYRDSTLTTLLAGPPPAVDVREPGIPPDLVAIVGKAMAREPSDRYPSAQALAADLKRFATGQLVGARRYSAWALARRLLRRHRPTAIVAAALIAALFAGVVGIVRASKRTAAENNRLRLKQAQAVLKEDPTAAVAWLKTHSLEPGRESGAVEVAAGAAATGVARYVLRLPDDTPARVCLSRSGQLAGVLGRQGAIWLFDVARGTRRRLGSLAGAPAAPCLFMDGDRRLIAAAARGGVMMAALPDGSASPLLETRAGVGTMEPFGDARVVVTGRDTRIHVVNVDGTGARLLQAPSTDHGDPLLSPDGRAIYICDGEGGLWRMDLEGGPPRLLDKLEDPSLQMDLSPDGRALVMPGSRVIGVRDLATGQTKWRPIGAAASSGGDSTFVLSFARWSTGGVLFVGGEQSGLRLWDPRTDEEVTVGARAYTAPPMMTRDRSRAAWLDREGTIHVLDVQSRLVRTLVGHQTALRGSAMTPDGRWLAVTHGGAARLFALPPPPAWRQDLRLRGSGRLVVPAGRELIAVVGGQSLVALDQRSGARRPLLDLGRPIRAFAISGDSQRAALTDSKGGALVVDLASSKTAELVPAATAVISVVFVGNDRLVGINEEGEVHVWELASGAHRIAAHLSSTGPGGRLFAARTAPRVFVTAIRNTLLLDLDSGRATPIDFGNTMNHRMISADGRLAVGGRFDGAVVLAEPQGEGVRTRQLTRRPGYVQDMAFTPDQRALFVADETGALARVEVATGATQELGRHPARIESIALSPSGRLVASSDITGEVRVWEPGTGALLVTPRTGVAIRLEFVGEDRLLSYGRDGWMQVSTIDPADLVPATAAGLSRRLAELTTARTDPTGETVSY